MQGVGFRWFVQHEAAALRLKGWVRNSEDGKVEAVAAGEVETLARLEEKLRQGSRGSRVDRVEIHELTENEGEKLGPFTIEGAW